MSDALNSQEISNEKKGWKGLLIAAILSVFFLGFFYLAITNEPDYMPSQKNKQQTAEAPVTTHQHDGQTMTDEEMKHMQHNDASAEHGH